MRPLQALTAFLLAVFTAIVPVHAHETEEAGLHVMDAWARATGGRTTPSAAYFTLHNMGEEAIAITGASSDVAAMTHLHETQEVDGVMRMRPVEDLVIAPKSKVTFKPGGLHVMLIKLKKPLAKGDTVTLTLDLLDHDPLVIEIPVKAAPPAAAKSGHHHH